MQPSIKYLSSSESSQFGKRVYNQNESSQFGKSLYSQNESHLLAFAVFSAYYTPLNTQIFPNRVASAAFTGEKAHQILGTEKLSLCGAVENQVNLDNSFRAGIKVFALVLNMLNCDGYL